MAKIANIDKDFDKIKFAELLKKAQGDRTQTKFASDCGLSVAYICKYLNMNFDKAPMSSTVRKIAETAENNVSYEELLEAAGYDSKKYLVKEKGFYDEYSFNHVLKVLAFKLIEQNRFKWTLLDSIDSQMTINPESPNSKTKEFDFSIAIHDDIVKNWYFDSINFLMQRDKDIPEDILIIAKDKIQKNIANMVFSGLEPNSKYSYVTTKPYIYNCIKSIELPKTLAVFVSVILISSNGVEKEEYLKGYLSDKVTEIKCTLV